MSLIPIATWRKSPTSSPQVHTINYKVFKRHFQDTTLQKKDGTKYDKKYHTPSKIPVPVRSDKSYVISVQKCGSEASSSSSQEVSPLSDAQIDEFFVPIFPIKMTPMVFQACQMIQTFPSCNTNCLRFKKILNWMKGPEQILYGNDTIETCAQEIDSVYETADILNQISSYFEQSKEEEQSSQNLNSSDGQYYSDILASEFEKEAKYQKLFGYASASEITKVDKIKRREIVKWIISAAATFNYSKGSVQIAVHIMDSFTRTKAVSVVGWPLLGLAAFHIAGKQEETGRVKLTRIYRYYKHLECYKPTEVIWMEGEILKALNFYVSPPTPKTFVDLAINSGHIVLPSPCLVKLLEILVGEILMRSVEEFDSNIVKSSCRAKLALQISSEYVMFYQDSFVKEMARPKPRDSEIIKKAKKHCYRMFQILVNQLVLALGNGTSTNGSIPNKLGRGF